MKIVFLGSPGVGKGTYTAKVVEKYGLIHISTGDIFRENIKGNTELGVEAKSYLDSGALVPDQVTINMVKDRLSKPDIEKGYILDGFPRTIPQANALGEFEKVDLVINFVADEKIILQRLGGRRICKQCGAVFHVTNIPPKQEGICDKCNGELYQRDDDKEEAIKERLKVYNEQTQPLVEYYSEKGLLKTVDANSSIIDDIVVNLVPILDEIKGEK